MSEKLMGITLIDDTEEFKFQPYPATKPEVQIIYRRMAETQQGEVRTRHTKDDRSGKADENAIGEEVLRYGLVRFENVFMADGKTVAPCTSINLRKLDAWIVERMILLICGRIPGYVHVPLS